MTRVYLRVIPPHIVHHLQDVQLPLVALRQRLQDLVEPGKPKQVCTERGLVYSQQRNSLSQGAEGVAEGFGRHAEQSLQEHVDLQGVESLALVWKRRTNRTRG